ncbi:glycoside hydrolase family 25 protein [Fodinicola acaciae]|uniref:glycoside hydrolase family 25 protein n=1 Tax=Fodinicola acaciae TaxID=2681555 RepID=UPI0013D4F972|nr:glycoside hydrolase family 25 protein [Fodinicola acaciae]
MSRPVVARGRDLSSYDSNVNYGAYDFIIGKFTESDNFVSPGALDRARATRAAGKVFSAYHFARPGNGAAQADFLLSVEMPKAGDMPGWLDYEVSGLGIGFVNAFSERYHARTGWWPGVYANLSTFQGELQSGRGWRRPGQRLWLARYGANGPGVACDIWQYQGGPDLNVAYTPLPEMVIQSAGRSAEMAMVTLSDERVAVVVRGTDRRPYVRVLGSDGGARTDWQLIADVVLGSAVGATTRDGTGLDMVALDSDDRSVLFMAMADAERPQEVYVQDLQGTGTGGAPGITAVDGNLIASVAGVLPRTGEVYLNRWDRATNTWRGWWDATGQAS